MSNNSILLDAFYNMRNKKTAGAIENIENVAERIILWRILYVTIVLKASYMPCTSVIESIKIILNKEECLESYHFVKQTCGLEVGGGALLLKPLKGLRVIQILSIDTACFLEKCRAKTEIAEFLYLKHLFAIQATLSTLAGKKAGGIKESCKVAEIGCADEKLEITAQIDVDLVTDKIKACGYCSNCRG